MAFQRRFWHRIGLLVATATMALVTVTIVTLVLGSRSKRELTGIETQYVPLIELDRDLKTLFTGVRRAFEDAANAAEDSQLAQADKLAAQFLQRLAEGRTTLVRNGADPARLDADFRAYVASTKGVAAAIIAGESMADLTEQVDTMTRRQQAYAAQLESATTPDRRRLTGAFEAARESQATALRIEIAVAIAAVLLMVMLSWWITRRAVRSLEAVAVGVERLAGDELHEDIRVDTADEIADLAREANRTAKRLREYRERSETLLAETQRQASELAVARAAQQERAEAAESATKELEAFSYSVAHDLRAPLRGINGFARALAEDLGDNLDEQVRKHLARITAGAVRMGELIDALLGLSRVSRAEVTRQRVDLSKLAGETVAQLRSADPSREVTVVIAENLVATGDPGLLRALFDNLIGNAWKFAAKRPSPRIEVGRSEDGKAFFVRDNGAGFDMAYANKLFAPFQRLHAAADYPGTGIGLATVQRIVHRHGGKIWAEGVVDVGATFFFTLASGESKE